MHNIIENMKRPRLLDQQTRLTATAKADITWWLLFTENWNGVGFFPAAKNAPKADHTRGNFCRRQHSNIVVRVCCAWKYRMVHSTSRLEIDGLSILKQTCRM